MTAGDYVRVDDTSRTIYLAPWTDDLGRWVVWYQHPGTFDTTRGTVNGATAARLRREGRTVPEAATPAWCDRDSPSVPGAAQRGV
jgi:hypothetical protein